MHKSSIYHLGLACLNLLEQIHSAGYVYNDLKLDNLLVDFKESLPMEGAGKSNCFANATINLVDFGFATKYMERNPESGLNGADDEHVHIQKTEVDVFRGNMIFSSTNQLQFYSTSRRDDLISLCYLLIYLVRRGELPKIDIYSKVERNESFRRIRDAKLSYKLKDLCNEADGTAELEEFVREVFGYRFKDEPKYDRLRKLLNRLFKKYSPTKARCTLEDAEMTYEQIPDQVRMTFQQNAPSTPLVSQNVLCQQMPKSAERKER